MSKKVQIRSLDEKKVEEANDFIKQTIYDLTRNFDVKKSELVISMPKYFQRFFWNRYYQNIGNLSAFFYDEKKFMDIKITENYLNEIAVYDVNCMFDNNETLKIFKL
ncbi:MAG: hypothetical protein C0525_01450 [Flavobacterium sp.]|uniref:hypothetical protein n=1 Tax=Flavobacterium sp. TaxID=239 RepID=UPI0025BA196A|nr:hypothetical protein [Flavobacterium sp.]MBA4133366.1 hypothetical protein [Flavobacterium sp.]